MNNFFNIQRFANISNSNSNSLVTGTSSSDSITNFGASVEVYAGAGND